MSENGIDTSESDIKKFILTTALNVACFFVMPLIILIFIISIFQFSMSVISGLIIIFLGNLFVYLLVVGLYYWKSTKEQINDQIVKEYFINKKVSLRPWTGYTEIITYVFFFLVQPQIIVGYLILRGITGYRGGGNEDSKKAELNGELNSIKAIGVVLNIFIGVIVAAFFHRSPIVRSVLENYFGWLK